MLRTIALISSLTLAACAAEPDLPLDEAAAAVSHIARETPVEELCSRAGARTLNHAFNIYDRAERRERAALGRGYERRGMLLDPSMEERILGDEVKVIEALYGGHMRRPLNRHDGEYWANDMSRRILEREDIPLLRRASAEACPEMTEYFRATADWRMEDFRAHESSERARDDRNGERVHINQRHQQHLRNEGRRALARLQRQLREKLGDEMDPPAT